jgi:PKD repeat protein
VSHFPGNDLDASGMTLFHLVRGDVAQIPAELGGRGFGPDPKRWYIQKWEDVPASNLVIDHPPLVTAPESLTTYVGSMLQFDVSASDLDAEPITSLIAEGAPQANFVRSADNRNGHLSWTPTSAEVGMHWVTFTASNRISGSATTRVNVVAGAAAPTVSLVAQPTSGNEPLTVTLDASGSVAAPGRRIARYRFVFADGMSADQTTPVITHVYSGGVRAASVGVMDDLGNTGWGTVTIRINSRPTAVLNVSPASGAAPLAVNLDGSISRDPEGAAIASYTFDFGDGSPPVSSGAATATHTYARGNYTASLTVTDDNGLASIAATKVISATSGQTPVDHAPVVWAPGSVYASTGAPLVVDVSASDQDGQAITSLIATGLPATATFVPNGNFTSGRLTWTPTPADIGPHTVRFTAANALQGSATTVITVAGNRAPYVYLSALPGSGSEPLPVAFSGADSWDPDGSIVNYRFDFGDGISVSQASPSARHVYMAGNWIARLTVTDNSGATAMAEATLSVSSSPLAKGASDAVDRLARAWRDRSVEEAKGLLTDDFAFQFAPGDPAGAPFPGHAWGRSDELLAVGRLFGQGFDAEPPASGLDLRFLETPIVGTSYQPGRPYPWHAQVLVPSLSLDIQRGVASQLHVEGRTLFSVVRGDSAHLPQELIDRGVRPDSTVWYIENWQDMTKPTEMNQAPVSACTLMPAAGVDPLTVWVDASHSSDEDGTIVSYRFDFGDGTIVFRSVPFAVQPSTVVLGPFASRRSTIRAQKVYPARQTSPYGALALNPIWRAIPRSRRTPDTGTPIRGRTSNGFQGGTTVRPACR